MDSWPTCHRRQRVEAPQHGPLVAGIFQSTIWTHPPRHCQHEVEQDHPEGSAQDVLGRIRSSLHEDERRVGQPDAAQAKRLAAG